MQSSGLERSRRAEQVAGHRLGGGDGQRDRRAGRRPRGSPAPRRDRPPACWSRAHSGSRRPPASSPASASASRMQRCAPSPSSVRARHVGGVAGGRVAEDEAADRAPRARACSSSSSTSTAAPSPITKPSRSRSKGRLAAAGVVVAGRERAHRARTRRGRSASPPLRCRRRASRRRRRARSARAASPIAWAPERAGAARGRGSARAGRCGSPRSRPPCCRSTSESMKGETRRGPPAASV